MVTTCDCCGKNIRGIVKEAESISNLEDWNDAYKLVKKERIKLVKSKFKKIFYKIFYIPSMPFYYESGLDFCDKECYETWKDIFNKLVREEIASFAPKEKSIGEQWAENVPPQKVMGMDSDKRRKTQ